LTTTVAIIGAGPLGRWLALSAARAGYSVRLEDVMPANLHHAQEWLRQELGPRIDALPQRLKPDPLYDLQTARLKPSPFKTSTNAAHITQLKPCSFKAEELHVGGVAFVSTIEDAVREADLVIDCVPDELESKLEILWLLDRMAPPRTVLATPTTRLSIADLANCTYRSGQVVAIVAEASSLTGKAEAGVAGAGGPEILLRTTSRTAAESVALVEGFWRRLGFVPVVECDAGETPR
jgi:3-hydroxybutyryl-CoA dehydrogenase